MRRAEVDATTKGRRENARDGQHALYWEAEFRSLNLYRGYALFSFPCVAVQ